MSVNRALLLVLGIPNAIAGAWAIIAPEHWYDHFPGWAPRLVAALPPYNEHLATDAGAGLFASGVLACYAAFARRDGVVVTAMLGYLAFAGPHAFFHLANPAEAMSAAEDAVNAATLWAAVLVAGFVLWRARAGTDDIRC